MRANAIWPEREERSSLLKNLERWRISCVTEASPAEALSVGVGG